MFPMLSWYYIYKKTLFFNMKPHSRKAPHYSKYILSHGARDVQKGGIIKGLTEKTDINLCHVPIITIITLKTQVGG
jgi:hypothetical protein